MLVENVNTFSSYCFSFFISFSQESKYELKQETWKFQVFQQLHTEIQARNEVKNKDQGT